MHAAQERTSFIGRRREILALSKELKAGARLLTLSGPSGMGKTRVARRLMTELAFHFEPLGGIRFCSLVGCQTLSDLETAIATSLGEHREHPSTSNPGAQGWGSPSSRRGPGLLILDNLDAFTRVAEPILDDLLERFEDLQILVTSLEPMGTSEEVCFELEPLEIPDAVSLYRDRVRRAWAGRVGAEDEEQVVEELVGRLDRIPLAIELAAARVRVLPPRAILSQMSTRFELLRSDRPGRHGSLYQALSISWDLLGPEEQRALAQTSVFVGGFNLEAARAILGDREGAADVVELLEGLRRQALLQLVGDPEPRFLSYESVRDFAAIQLRKMDIEEETQRRHVSFFLERGEGHVSKMNGPEAPASIRWLGVERENLLAAYRRSRRLDPKASERLGFALASVLAHLDPSPSELEIVESVVASTREAVAPLPRIRALRARSGAMVRHGKPAEARADLHEALELASGCGERLQAGYALAELGPLRVRAGEVELAMAEQERALRVAREEGDPKLEALVLYMMGSIEESRSDFRKACEFMEQSLAIARRQGDLRAEEAALYSLGVIFSDMSRFREARQAMQDAREKNRILGNRSMDAYVLLNLGGLELTAGFPDEAERYTLEALRSPDAPQHPRFEAQAMLNLGLVAFSRSNLHLAEQRLLQALARLQEIGDSTHRARMLPLLASAEALLGRSGEANHSLREARAFFEELDDRSSLEAVDFFGGFIELAQARRFFSEGEETKARSLVERIRSRLAAAMGSQDAVPFLAFGRRLLEGMILEATAPAQRPVPSERLTVASDGSWFQLGAEERVKLGKRETLKQILLALAKQRVGAPGVGFTIHETFEIGWPGEEINPVSARRRVYTAVWTLRSLGLASAILFDADRYLIDSSVPVVIS